MAANGGDFDDEPKVDVRESVTNLLGSWQWFENQEGMADGTQDALYDLVDTTSGRVNAFVDDPNDGFAMFLVDSIQGVLFPARENETLPNLRRFLRMAHNAGISVTHVYADGTTTPLDKAHTYIDAIELDRVTRDRVKLIIDTIRDDYPETGQVTKPARVGKLSGQARFSDGLLKRTLHEHNGDVHAAAAFLLRYY